ncbi:CvpA family protein [Gottfriedia sp. NPDC056225]|uniref:CvpA family protein n=1 Tax=Gottfriedia sp. NPDC056225 TaxID=3345751 RepID=UPI0015592E50|nr:CvpA family protein [Arthrobacter citreus]
MIDLIILIIFVLGILTGWRRGFVSSLVRLLGFLLSLYLAYHYYEQTATSLKKLFPMHINGSQVVNVQGFAYEIIAFALLFIGTRLVITFIGSLVNGIFQLPVLKQMNAFLGGILGFIEVYLFSILALFIALIVPIDTVHDLLHKSNIAYFMVQHTPFISNQLMELWNGISSSEIL